MFKILLLIVICALPRTSNSETCAAKWDNLKSKYNIADLYKPLEGLCDIEFRDKLLTIISTNIDLGYYNARNIMFSDLDNHGGQVCDVYTSSCISTKGIPSSNLMNCEHTWPQSKGAGGIAKSDLNHLFPASSKANSMRSNLPFCETIVSTWRLDGSRLGQSMYGTKCFETRDAHKGEVARALMYFSVRYTLTIDQEQEEYLRKWNTQFAPDTSEIDRNNKIEEIQKNRNPFVDVPEFAGLIEDF